MPSDILVLPGNTQGMDYIIGDVHGSANLLQTTLSKSAPHDRLFMVGDIIDRGPDSVAAFKLIQHDPRVVMVKGNHEETLLKFTSIDLQVMFSEIRQYDLNTPLPTNLQALWDLLAYDGSWIFKDPEARELPFNPHAHPLRAIAPYLSYLGKGFVHELTEMVRYFSNCPYVVAVQEGCDAKGNRVVPFVVCHSRLPLSDAALFQKQRSLTPAEKQVLLYSRSSDAVIPRSSNAMICYAGHSPHYHGYAAVRPLENTCNLDAGAFQNGVLMCVNHTCREVTPVIGTQSLESFDYWQLMQDPKKNEEATVARFEANRQQYLKSSVWEEVQEHLWQNHITERRLLRRQDNWHSSAAERRHLSSVRLNCKASDKHALPIFARK